MSMCGQCPELSPHKTNVMRSILSIILMLAMVALPASAFNPTKSPQRKAAHMIVFAIVEDGQTGKALCSSSAIGPHALLTAGHCDMGETELTVDNELSPRAIFSRINDGEDHVIFLVGGSAFKDTMAKFYSPDTYAPDKVGDEIFLWGDGAGLYPPQFRQGRSMGTIVIPDKELKGMLVSDPNLLMFDVNIIGGDSGSAIYDLHTGKLVTLVTYGVEEKFCGAYILHFSQAQVEQAEKF